MKYTIEKLLNVNIPEGIKKIIETNRKMDIIVDGEMNNFIVLSPDEMLEAYKEQKDLFDYNIIPFAFLDDDYLCLNYKNHNISIIYWSSERAMESKELAIFELYSSYDDFIKTCITNKIFVEK
ncbi:SMI1/KNR4 family protein [Butyrivibrio sp. XBB1001]|uniref:SMI1/KNR4 family protein n=1 Tax=Butyrivibrio sp. XBB1001 TaxID=1280682 RepID=UPI000408861A|nr:SMI1/KNR4 family protein [Butyrivibrio sp. XBB1001]